MLLEPKTLLEITRAIPDKLVGYVVCKLFQSNHDQWETTGLQGCIVLCNDESKKLSMLRMIDLRTMEITWEHEIYGDLQLQILNDAFCCFETDDCFIGMNCAKGSDLCTFRNGLSSLTTVKTPSDTKASKNAKSPTFDSPRGKSFFSGFRGLFGKRGKEETRPAEIVIGGPKGMERGLHVGYDAGRGGFVFENLPSEWESLESVLTGGGVTPDMLGDRKMLKTIDNVIKTFAKERGYNHNGEHSKESDENADDMDEDVNGENDKPTPTEPNDKRLLPPPPPPHLRQEDEISQSPLPPPPPPSSHPGQNISIPLPPFPPTGGLPPPPSPPTEGLPPPPPPMHVVSSDLPSGAERPDLMAAIRNVDKAKLLKTPTAPSTPIPSSDRGDLMASIRDIDRSKLLKPTPEPSKKLSQMNEKDQNDLMGLIQFAIAKRKEKMGDGDSDDSDDDWD